jgi:hypothetical protein
LNSCKNGGGARKGFSSQYLSCGAAKFNDTILFHRFVYDEFNGKVCVTQSSAPTKENTVTWACKKIVCNNFIYLIFNLFSLQFKLHQVKLLFMHSILANRIQNAASHYFLPLWRKLHFYELSYFYLRNVNNDIFLTA